MTFKLVTTPTPPLLPYRHFLTSPSTHTHSGLTSATHSASYSRPESIGELLVQPMGSRRLPSDENAAKASGATVAVDAHTRDRSSCRPKLKAELKLQPTTTVPLNPNPNVSYPPPPTGLPHPPPPSARISSTSSLSARLQPPAPNPAFPSTLTSSRASTAQPHPNTLGSYLSPSSPLHARAHGTQPTQACLCMGRTSTLPLGLMFYDTPTLKDSNMRMDLRPTRDTTFRGSRNPNSHMLNFDFLAQSSDFLPACP